MAESSGSQQWQTAANGVATTLHLRGCRKPVGVSGATMGSLPTALAGPLASPPGCTRDTRLRTGGGTSSKAGVSQLSSAPPLPAGTQHTSKDEGQSQTTSEQRGCRKRSKSACVHIHILHMRRAGHASELDHGRLQEECQPHSATLTPHPLQTCETAPAPFPCPRTDHQQWPRHR